MRDRTGAGERRLGEFETRRWGGRNKKRAGERSEADEKRGKGEEVHRGNGGEGRKERGRR